MANEVALEKVSKPIFGITSRRYRQMASDGIVPLVSQGKIDFVQASKTLIEYYRKLAEGQGSLNLTDVRTRKEAARAEREELIVKKLKGELVPKNASISWLIALGSAAKLAFQGLPRRLAPVVILYNDEKEIEVIIRDEIYKIIRELEKPLDVSRPGRRKKRSSK
jgi:hypothetical protein